MPFPRGQQAGNFKDRTGERHGRLVVVAPFHRRKLSGKKVVDWACRCDCGGESRVAGADLASGKVVSCGCYRAENTAELSTTHGQSSSDEFHVWAGMIDRCGRQKNKSYKDYGARGISVCERWRGSFANFLADMGARPTKRHTIERIDNDGNYEPSNCCWLPKSEQSRNRRPQKREAGATA